MMLLHLQVNQISYYDDDNVVAPEFIYHGILQRNYRKMIINGHFPRITL